MIRRRHARAAGGLAPALGCPVQEGRGDSRLPRWLVHRVPDARRRRDDGVLLRRLDGHVADRGHQPGHPRRLLASPARHTAVSLGGVVSNALSIVVQALVIVALGVAAGARPHNGVLGIATLLLVAVLIGSAFAALSNALALVTRREESLIGAVQMLLLPLTFLSATFMQRSLLPGWIQWVARFNPMNWAVDAARAAISSGADWELVGSRLGFLAALSLACSVLATRAFGAYQRSL
ncbi:MAG TPA: ABC transporter permease [Gaiellaceae bacterium]